MKKSIINKILIGCSLLPLVSTVSITSCSNKKVQSNLYYHPGHFETVPVIPTVYQNNDFSFSFKLKDKCYMNDTESYVIGGDGQIHLFGGRCVKCTYENGTYTVTVDKSIVTRDVIDINISTFRVLNVDTSGSTSDFDFDTALMPNPIQGERYTFGFKINNNKGLDVVNSKIYIGGLELTRDYYSLFEKEIDSTIYTFISISPVLMSADVKLDLKAADYVTFNSKSYPEYSLSYTSAPVKNNGFTCYLTPSAYGGFVYDKDNIVVKVDGTALTAQQYTFDDSTTIATLTIPADVIKEASSIYVDVPVIEAYTCYACREYENPTVVVEGDPIIKDKAYTFKVYGLDDKDILWDNSNTYITVNDERITKDNGFTVTQEEPGKLVYTVTVEAKYAIADMYCHFITESK